MKKKPAARSKPRARKSKAPAIPTSLDPHSPPAGLSERARRLWRSVNQEFDLEQSQLGVLEAALMCFDRFLGARAKIEREGITITSGRSRVVHANPAVKIEEAAWRSFVRGFEMLRLDYDQEEKRGPGRPPDA